MTNETQRRTFREYLEQYSRQIDGPLESPQYFATAWKIACAEIPIVDLCDEFKVCESTVRRYMQGRSMPVPLARKVVLDRLVKLLEK